MLPDNVFPSSCLPSLRDMDISPLFALTFLSANPADLIPLWILDAFC
jgi:hypothetical protein